MVRPCILEDIWFARTDHRPIYVTWDVHSPYLRPVYVCGVLARMQKDMRGRGIYIGDGC